MSVDEAIDLLVTANHILADQGVVDGFGHVSVRHPERNGLFLLSRSMAPARVTRGDIILHDDNGEPVDADSRAVYVERFLHAETYRRRPDVTAVAHSHSPSVIPFSISSVKLRPCFHMASFLNDSSRFEIREHFGRDTNLLISDSRKGRYMAQALPQGAPCCCAGTEPSRLGAICRRRFSGSCIGRSMRGFRLRHWRSAARSNS
ncbi:hypothetical protein BM43_4059 [Burkholderia gladioli]|nr:class II aldolase/adducin family protein [Burkholderia gladioli]AJW97246.1 hypothetical protein BM43_4059 [Burkholderia gladioli]